MVTEALKCPSCGSPVASSPDAAATLRCGYCDTRYRVKGHKAVAAGVPGAPGSDAPATSPRAMIIAAASVLVLGLGVFAAVVSGSEDDPRPLPAPDLDLVPPVERVAPKEVAQEVSQAVKAAAAAPTAEWVAGGRVASSGSNFYLLGHVKNTSPYTIDHPKVIAVLRDAAGKEVGLDHGYAERDQLAPGEVSPVSVLVSKPPAHTSVDVELELSRASYLQDLVEGLEVEALEPSKDGIFGWTFSGTVRHQGTVAARFVKVEVQALDEQGRLIGLATTYVGGDRMEPGATARFNTTGTRTETDPARMIYSVRGRPAP